MSCREVTPPNPLILIPSSGFGQVLSNLDNFNTLGNRDSQFNTVTLPQNTSPVKPPVEEDISSINKNLSPSRHTNSLPATPVIEDYRTRKISGSPVRFGRMDMTLREDQGDKPGTLNGTSDNGVVVSTDTATAAAKGRGIFSNSFNS